MVITQDKTVCVAFLHFMAVANAEEEVLRPFQLFLVLHPYQFSETPLVQ